MRGRTCRRRLFYIPLAMHREAANAQAHLQTASVSHTAGYAPRSRQCAGALADGICFIYRWLCTEKPPMRRHTCRRHPFYIPLAMHREAANARAHLQTTPVLHTDGYAPRSRQCTAQRPACSAGTGMPLSPTTRAHGKCAYAMSRRMPNRPQLTPAGMSAQPQRKLNAHKVRPARVRRLRHPKTITTRQTGGLHKG